MRPPSAERAAAGDARRLARSITATWWYTVSGVAVFELLLPPMVTIIALEAGGDAGRTWTVGIGGAVWWVATLLLLLQYRRRDDAAAVASWRIVVPIILCVVYGVVAGTLTGLWSVAGFAVLQPLVLLTWPRGVRLRVTLGASVVLLALVLVDQRFAALPAVLESSSWAALRVFAVILPVMTVLSLWWWDVLVVLDRARAAQERVGAMQERLRVANDVHDLQGHHLQVIALQLELADRLLERGDPAGAVEQLRSARTSVDEARQGTRDLALRFRSVPLRDEIANAVDLLRAAGTEADATVDPTASSAPASILGPVVRETTTNALRHGGGRWARLSLTRPRGYWRYEIANDAAHEHDGSADGSGLDGIARRAAEAGGTADVVRGRTEFTVIVTIPEEEG